MKVFSVIAPPAAVEVQKLGRGETFSPEAGGPIKRLFVLVAPINAPCLQFDVFDSGGARVRLVTTNAFGSIAPSEYCVGADLETGELVAFYLDTLVIPVPSHVVTGRVAP